MMKTYSNFNTAIENFEGTISELLASADQAETMVKDLQGQKVNALMTQDIAGAVLLSKQIIDNQEIVSHNRESAELMRMGKWKAFVNMISGVNTEKDVVVADALKRFEVKAAAVAKLKESYMKGLAELGEIFNEAKGAADEAAEVVNVVNEFEGNPSKQTYRYPRMKWESPTTELRLFVPNERRTTQDGLIAISEHDQVDIFKAGKLLK